MVTMDEKYQNQILQILFKKSDIDKLDVIVLNLVSDIRNNLSSIINGEYSFQTEDELNKSYSTIADLIDTRTPSFDKYYNLNQEVCNALNISEMRASECRPKIKIKELKNSDGNFEPAQNIINIPGKSAPYNSISLAHEHTHYRELPFRFSSVVSIIKNDEDEDSKNMKLSLLEILEEGFANQNSSFATNNFSQVYGDERYNSATQLSNFWSLTNVHEVLGKEYNKSTQNWTDLRNMIFGSSTIKSLYHDIGYTFYILNNFDSEEDYHNLAEEYIL